MSVMETTYGKRPIDSSAFSTHVQERTMVSFVLLQQQIEELKEKVDDYGRRVDKVEESVIRLQDHLKAFRIRKRNYIEKMRQFAADRRAYLAEIKNGWKSLREEKDFAE